MDIFSVGLKHYETSLMLKPEISVGILNLNIIYHIMEIVGYIMVGYIKILGYREMLGYVDMFVYMEIFRYVEMPGSAWVIIHTYVEILK